MKNYNILIVDNYPEFLTVVCYALGRKGYQVTTASSGKEAIEALAIPGFDLVITDLDMPEVDGLAVLKKAKELDPDRGVMIMTGNASPVSAMNALRLGADDYLLKPFSMAVLWDRVSSCLDISEVRQNARKERRTTYEQGRPFGQSHRSATSCK
jgi:DNA-binding NtrC family response regulator